MIRRQDPDLLVAPAADRGLPALAASGPQPGCSRSLRAHGLQRLTVVVDGLHPGRGRVEALHQRDQAVVEHAVDAQVGRGAARDRTHRLGEPDLLGELAPLHGLGDRAGGVDGVLLQQTDGLGGRALTVVGQVDGQ